MLELTERKKQILIAIVEAYTENSKIEPIGSTELLKLLGYDVSTATLRNEMNDLEEMGYLKKTHTSSGRIPTEKGYRLYVDKLVEIDNDIDNFENYINYAVKNSTSANRNLACEEALTNFLNNKQVNYSALMLEKTAYNSIIRKIDFIHTRNHQGIFLVVTDKGHIFNNEVAVPEGISISKIAKTVEYLNAAIKDKLLYDIKLGKEINLSQEFVEYISQTPAVIEFVIANIQKLLEDKKHYISPYNILNHGDFSDINFAQTYLDAIKNDKIYQMIDFDEGPIPSLVNHDCISISTKIGSEHQNPLFNNFSSITAYYSSSEGTGAITVYGPIRMKYKNIMALLVAVAKVLNNQNNLN